jgi:hypothetical protein
LHDFPARAGRPKGDDGILTQLNLGASPPPSLRIGQKVQELTFSMTILASPEMSTVFRGRQ